LAAASCCAFFFACTSQTLRVLHTIHEALLHLINVSSLVRLEQHQSKSKFKRQGMCCMQRFAQKYCI